ncbi:lipopolysaccharide assembly protein LapA domain-containing protein [Pseudomonas sp. PS01298]|uniref:lipopolysaccharide assembly protein LapA domain-containing protein n=1 Tax=Pseudomonas sp. PS01298 TaxID=2991434 RepID=UPI000EA0CB5F|nr:lipopolysaccharide assembly protein LapA domain-containing protein [Pseudomonas sp. PS01298]AYF51847.1 DUF1049 domain-containing protein [Pseudomonas fluorescens]QTV18324.1 DUF1049 domain-containing protein [Pseudomonas fluorescens]
MLGLKRVLFLLFMLMIAVFVILFVLGNQQMVSLMIFGWSAPAVPLAIPMIFSLLLGLAIGPVLGVYIVIRAKRRVSADA